MMAFPRLCPSLLRVTEPSSSVVYFRSFIVDHMPFSHLELAHSLIGDKVHMSLVTVACVKYKSCVPSIVDGVRNHDFCFRYTDREYTMVSNVVNFSNEWGQ